MRHAFRHVIAVIVSGGAQHRGFLAGTHRNAQTPVLRTGANLKSGESVTVSRRDAITHRRRQNRRHRRRGRRRHRRRVVEARRLRPRPLRLRLVVLFVFVLVEVIVVVELVFVLVVIVLFLFVVVATSSSSSAGVFVVVGGVIVIAAAALVVRLRPRPWRGAWRPAGSRSSAATDAPSTPASDASSGESGSISSSSGRPMSCVGVMSGLSLVGFSERACMRTATSVLASTRDSTSRSASDSGALQRSPRRARRY